MYIDQVKIKLVSGEGEPIKESLPRIFWQRRCFFLVVKVIEFKENGTNHRPTSEPMPGYLRGSRFFRGKLVEKEGEWISNCFWHE
jgi:hypothetical protein